MDGIALSHIANEPVAVHLSTGYTVTIFPVPLSVLSDIANQEEVARIAILQYQALQAAGADPEERIWEQGRRLRYFSHAYVRGIGALCEAIACATHPPVRGFFGSVRAYLRARRTRRELRRATWQDWLAVMDTWKQMNDIDAIVGAVMGTERAQKKSTVPPAPPEDAESAQQPPDHAGGSRSDDGWEVVDQTEKKKT